ncbi:DUF2933 domain-containing protein [Cupriavidus basilensis]
MHRDERYLRQESRDEMQCENDGHYRRCPGGDTGYRLRPVPAGPRARTGCWAYLLLLLCPLSMRFMMKSMSAHDDQLSSMTEERSEQKPQPFRIKE